MIITHSPELRAAFPQLGQEAAPLPLATDQVYRGMFQNMHLYGDLDPQRDMIEYMRMVPKEGWTPESIKSAYAEESKVEDFSHEWFVTRCFDFPIPTDGEKVRYTPGKDLDEHARAVMLGHLGTAKDGPITIGTENEGMASGGRYSDGREDKGIFYYWDQAAIVDALDVLGLHGIADGIVANIRDQIIKYQRPPFNANAPEYVGRSQPPIYVRLVRRDVRIHGEERWKDHLPALLIEHAYLMEHSSVDTPGGELNVFSAEGYVHEDGEPRFRPESFPAVMKIVEECERDLDRKLTKEELIWLCRQDHSGAGAGTDFAGWMCANPEKLYTLRTTERATPFQQGLMFELECGIAEGLESCGFEAEANDYKLMAYNRAQAVEQANYDPATNYYYPYDVETGQVRVPTLQDGIFMLMSGMVPPERAPGMFDTIEENMLMLNGLICSAYESDLSWDKNIWAYFQVCAAMAAYLHDHPIEEIIAKRFTQNVQAGRDQMGYTIERYAPAETEEGLGKPGGGGEYEAPKRNFVWTDAVDVILRHMGHRLVYEVEAFLRRRQIAQGVGVIGAKQVLAPTPRIHDDAPVAQLN